MITLSHQLGVMPLSDNKQPAAGRCHAENVKKPVRRHAHHYHVGVPTRRAVQLDRGSMLAAT
jgi:hypothetical protein